MRFRIRIRSNTQYSGDISGGSDAPVFLVGDPKQAIYSFRGADIFVYLKAARDARALLAGAQLAFQSWLQLH